MNKAKRKNILIDLSDLKHPNCGFGQIAINYSKRFANLPIEGLHFFYLLPNCYPKIYNPQIQISAESETKRSIFREKDKTKRSKKESAQHSKSRNKSFVMTSVSAL